ncbi:MAG: hypothetical protein ACAI35_00930 [Candidatus Methylacidiphilales bacterium]|nr:hypothetical protein [Candidatus Methylacidiphilales bacterium]
MLTINSLIIFDFDGDLQLYDGLLTLASNIEPDDLYEDGVRNRVAFDSNGYRFIVSLSTNPGFDYIHLFDFKYPAKVFQLPAESRNAEELNQLLKEFHERLRINFPKEAFPDFQNASTEEILKYYIAENMVTTLTKRGRCPKRNTWF